ncbi:MAG: glycosyl transferase [Bacteroidales bacterium]|nr:glycosyl transferase [Bacteroidales bacterium]
MLPLTTYILHPRLVLLGVLGRCAKYIKSDELYLKLRFRLEMRKRLNLKNPKTFNEKLQWLKLYNRKPEYTTMVDKYAVKQYVADKIGDEYIIPTLGVWDKPEDIDYDSLPDKFVLKTTHGGGGTGVLLCRDKATFNKEEACRKLNKSLQSDIYVNLREWPYKDVPKRIIAEQFIENESGKGLTDYKFFCFNGRTDCVMACYERVSGHTKFYFFDKDWQLLRLNVRGKNAPQGFSMPKPENYDKMIDLANTVSKDIPFLRLDLYNVNGRIYFGEMTFFPQSGFDRNLLSETEDRFGSLINITI